MKLPEIEQASATVKYISGEDSVETIHGIYHGVLSVAENHTMLIFILEDGKFRLIPFEHIISLDLEDLYVTDKASKADINYG